MVASRILIAFGVAVAAGGAAFAALAWHPAIPPVERPAASSFDPAAVKRGAALAALGNCAGCHSAPGRPAFGGGLPVETPFGAIYASNITPDPEAGIGRWSEAAFRRAMRDGVDREGRNLYPAFPYNHYTRVTDDDDAALYAYLMTRRPSAAAVRPPALPFPLNLRPVMAGWNLLFFRAGAFAPDPARSPEWNRGAYLVEGLGHCGACHTPHGVLGEEKAGHHLGGGMAEGWNAYALNAASPAPLPWTVDSLAFYLHHGWQAEHGAARGPMALVTAELGTVSDAEARAMAVYLVSLMGRPESRPADAPQAAAPLPPASAGGQVAVSDAAGGRGAALYAGACASCHASGRPLPYGGLDLALSSALRAPDPSNVVTVTLHGLAAPPGAPGSIMPGFDGALDDADLVALLRYLRADVARAEPWPDLDAAVRRARARGATLVASDGAGPAPPDAEVRIAR
ncbi:cytochrome c [Lichenibacterium dinghuense]|uniref:cytochrome c n=1 Tax=Lichenibacterium dinghuense TaxID=2895977 RepID=UPI001F00A25C|nr:cytochrome c [Lichenibacterium sp. 6Y81]